MGRVSFPVALLLKADKYWGLESIPPSIRKIILFVTILSWGFYCQRRKRMAEPKLGRERGEEPGQRAKPHTGPCARGRGEGRSGHPRTVLCHERPDGQISRVSFYTWEPRRVCMVEDNWTRSTRICLAFPIDNPRFMLAWPRQASWGGRRPRGGSPAAHSAGFALCRLRNKEGLRQAPPPIVLRSGRSGRADGCAAPRPD